MSAECDVAVVGAGIAGLTAAVRPARSGRDGVRRLDGNPLDVSATRFSGGAQQLAHRMAQWLPTTRCASDIPSTEWCSTRGGSMSTLRTAWSLHSTS